jgi:hypothetical protein
VTLVTEITNSAKEFGTQDFRNSSGNFAILTAIRRASLSRERIVRKVSSNTSGITTRLVAPRATS